MSAWPQWLYQYGVVAVLFTATVVLSVKTGALQLRRGADRGLLLALVAGLLAFMAIHAVWIVLAGGAAR